jgi:hypothetical protein
MSNYRHGLAKTPIYNVWNAMIGRCHNPNSKAYSEYGGRGIHVCEKWRSFTGFYEDMGDRPEGATLERVDNNKGYSPDNVVWADRNTQARNKRNNVLLTVNGETRCLTEWSELTGIKVATLWARVKRGWTAEQVVRAPLIRERMGISNRKGSRLVDAAFGAQQGVVWTDPTEREAAA